MSQKFSLRKVFYTSKIPELKVEVDRIFDDYNECDCEMFRYITTKGEKMSEIVTENGCLYEEEVIIIDDLK